MACPIIKILFVPARSALREVGLNFYDHRAIVVEVVARLDGLCAAAARQEPLYARQLLALEALQVGFALKACVKLWLKVRFCHGRVISGFGSG